MQNVMAKHFVLLSSAYFPSLISDFSVECRKSEFQLCIVSTGYGKDVLWLTRTAHILPSNCVAFVLLDLLSYKLLCLHMLWLQGKQIDFCSFSCLCWCWQWACIRSEVNNNRARNYATFQWVFHIQRTIDTAQASRDLWIANRLFLLANVLKCESTVSSAFE